MTVNIVQFFRNYSADRLARLTEEEQAFVANQLRLTSNGMARRLLDTGAWVDVPAGTVLTEEGLRPEFLWYISSGHVTVQRLGTRIAQCGPGNFIGEMALLEDGSVASATSITEQPLRAWTLSYDKLQPLERAQPEAYAALYSAFARDMRLKLIASNALDAGI